MEQSWGGSTSEAIVCAFLHWSNTTHSLIAIRFTRSSLHITMWEHRWTFEAKAWDAHTTSSTLSTCRQMLRARRSWYIPDQRPPPYRWICRKTFRCIHRPADKMRSFENEVLQTQLHFTQKVSNAQILFPIFSFCNISLKINSSIIFPV